MFIGFKMICGACGLILLAAGAGRAGEAACVTNRVAVPAGGSHTGGAFTYTRALRGQNGGHAVYELRYPSPVVTPHAANNTVPAELYLPKGLTGKGPFPAVVCLHILHGNFDLERMLCTRLARSGVIALFFKQPFYGERGGKEGRRLALAQAPIFIQGLEQGLEDARRAVDILQAMPEVNPGRIGITGISMGAIQAASVCGREPRVTKAFLTLGGGDLRSILLQARETRAMRAFIQGLPEAEQERVWACVDRIDPLNAKEALRRLAAAGKLRMVCAERDEVVPPACARKLADAAGCADRITWLAGLGHYTAMAAFPRILGDISAFFGEDAPPDWTPPGENGEGTPTALLARFLAGLATLLGSDPLEQTAHLAGGEAEVTQDGKTFTCSFDFARGTQGRFRLQGEFPVVGQAGLGYGSCPWLIGGGKTVFCGTRDAGDGRPLSARLAPQGLLRYRVAVGALTAAALAPEALGQYYTLREEPAGKAGRRIRLILDYRKAKGFLTLTFAAQALPTEIEWDFGKARGRLRLTHWRVNAVADDALFEAPAGLPRREVRQEDLLRMFVSAAEFGLEAME